MWTSIRTKNVPGPFGDFGYGPRFPGHPSDFFPGGPMGFIGSHPGSKSLNENV